jgi:hypothetical protein
MTDFEQESTLLKRKLKAASWKDATVLTSRYKTQLISSNTKNDLKAVVHNIKNRFRTVLGGIKKFKRDSSDEWWRGRTVHRTIHGSVCGTVHYCAYITSDVAPEDLVAVDTPRFVDTPDNEIPDFLQLHVIPVFNERIINKIIIFDDN